MPDIIWKDDHIEVKPPKRTKKLTGTRFASIFGLNPYSTPFEIWCAVTKTYEPPFEDTIYTIAGKTIEPKQAEFMKDVYMFDNLVTPTEKFGPDYFNKTYGDFFHEWDVFGGMWDYLLVDKNGNPTTVLEMKTTKKSEDWKEDIPEYYALQAALYAYLLKVDDVIMVFSVLDPAKGDYQHPEQYVCTPQNTFTRSFKLSERYPNFQQMIDSAVEWWTTYVTKGISPAFDEKKDAEILEALRTAHVPPTEDLTALMAEAEALKDEIDAHAKEIKDKEDRLKAITDRFKEAAKSQFKDGDKEAVLTGTKYVWKMTRSVSMKLDEAAIKKDGLFDKYAKPTESYRATWALNKKGE